MKSCFIDKEGQHGMTSPGCPLGGQAEGHKSTVAHFPGLL